MYCKEVLGIQQTWRLQDELLTACTRAVKEHKPIYIGSGHALGKDYISAGISLWFLQTFIPSIVIQTGPTDRQVKQIMWKETSSHWQNKKIDLGGRAFTEPHIEIDKDWYLIGFTTKETGATKEGGGGKFQGYHSHNICVIVTEAQAIEDTIYDQVDAIATSENCLIIFLGNPTRSRGRFATGLRNKKDNIVFNFSCLENPNYIERKTIIPGLASYEWVEDKRKRWGEDDPRWISRVLGQIPENATNNTFPDWLINHMKSRYGLLNISGIGSGVAVDPAGEGVDDNEFMSGKGGDVLNIFSKTLMSPSDIAHQSVKMCKEIEGDFIVVDCDGIGIGTYQELKKLDSDYLQGINIVKFHGSASSEILVGGKKIYENQRSEASFLTQSRAKAGKASIDLNAKELIEDLQEEEYFTNKKGLLQIEPKEDLKERLGRSPGKGDAYKMLQWGLEKGFKRKQVFANTHSLSSVAQRQSETEYSVLDY